MQVTAPWKANAEAYARTAEERYRNLRISKALLKSLAHQGTSLFTSAPDLLIGATRGVA